MKGTILLVEDSESDEILALRALAKCGVASDVVVARDGAQALNYLFEAARLMGPEAWQLPRVTLLDLNLPKVDGFEVLRRVRAHERTRLLPIVVLTSSKREEDVRRCYALGANAYLCKAVDFAAFSDATKALEIFWLRFNEPPPLLSRAV